MKPQLSHLSLQCNSIIAAPQRSHTQVLVSDRVVEPMLWTPDIGAADVTVNRFWFADYGAGDRAENRSQW